MLKKKRSIMQLRKRLQVRWWGIGVLLSGIIWAGNISSDGQQPPSPAPVSPNASLVTATVLKYSIWDAKLFKDKRPTVLPGQVLYSLIIEIESSAAVSAQLQHLAQVGATYEGFSVDPLGVDLFGKRIQAILKLTGDTRGVRWALSDILVLR
jgi:hypothetical protein